MIPNVQECKSVAPSELISQRVQRKLQSDGYISTIKSAVELLARRHIGHLVFDSMVEYGAVRTLSRSDLQNVAVEMVETTGDSDDGVPQFVSHINEGYVLTETGLATTSSFEILEESAGAPDYARQAMMEMFSRELFFGQLPVREIFTTKTSTGTDTLSTVAPLIPRYPSNYFHWMVETVPKVRYLQQYKRRTGTEVTVLISSNAPPFVEETLALLEWPKDRILRAVEPMYKVRDLILPSSPERTEADFDWLRKEILDNVLNEETVTPNGTAKRIYISRANAMSRRVVNEEEVIDVLSDYGFKRYLLEDRSLMKNAELFNNADIVVGPHGAGLTDIIFAENCTLIEFFGARLNKAYESLSKTLGINYKPMYCQADSADIIVNTGRLRQRVNECIDET